VFAYEIIIGLDNKDRVVVHRESLLQKDSNDKPLLSFEFGKGCVIDENKVQKEIALSNEGTLGLKVFGSLNQYPIIVELYNFLMGWRVFSFNEQSLKLGASMNSSLARDGSNLQEITYKLWKENTVIFNSVIKEFEKIVPEIERVQPSKLADGQVVLQFWEKGFSQPFYPQQLSSSVLKLFAYCLSCWWKPGTLTVFDDVEDGLDSRVTQKLLSSLGEVAKNNNFQLIMTIRDVRLATKLNLNNKILIKQNGGTIIGNLKE